MKKIRRPGIVILLSLLVLLLFLFEKNDLRVVSQNSFSMNTLMRISAVGHDEKNLDKALKEAFRILDDLNDRMSLYQETSVLSEINRQAGVRPISVGPDVFSVVHEAAELCKRTDNSFNPLVGPLTQLWKINQQSKTEYRLPTQASIDVVLPLTNIDNLTLAKPDKVYLKQKGCVLDLGGIAKGYASMKIAQFFLAQDIHSALIDLGGNIYALGSQPKGSPWNIGIKNPVAPDAAPVAILQAENTSVITSGSYERYRIVDGKRYSHLFDPSTGYPVDNEMKSATVVSPNAAMADALATAFMVMGLDRASKFLTDHTRKTPSLGAIFIHPNLDRDRGDGEAFAITATSNLKDRLKVLANWPIRYIP